jgi:hypothetical protein
MNRVLNRTTRKGLAGYRALLAAAVGQKWDDARDLSGDREEVAVARAYFASTLYDRDLTLLGLPGDWLPEHEHGQSRVLKD